MKPFHLVMDMTEETLGQNHGPGAPRMFANAAQEYFDKYGGGIEHLAKIGQFVCMFLSGLLCAKVEN